MKREYQKPIVVFENFELCQAIAATCGMVTNSSQGVCGYLPPRDPSGLPVFIDGVSGCVRKENDGDYNGVCYHVPVDSQNLFSS